MSSPRPALRNLIVVACHAPFKEAIEAVPDHPEHDDAWVLQPFQLGEPLYYIEHIRQGVDLLAEDCAALLMFSGGYTRREAGLRWSEADTYAAIARHFRWWTSRSAEQALLAARTTTEDCSRDSFENLLFSLCRFRQVAGHYPRAVTVVSWAFKRARLSCIGLPCDFHRSSSGSLVWVNRLLWRRR
jgi:hypothetical protein